MDTTRFSRPLPDRFRTADQVRNELQSACASRPGLAEFITLGHSEQGRPVDAVILGNGARVVSLIAGSHSDEPVGSETLRWLICALLAEPQHAAATLAEYRLLIVPQVNPDGEVINARWSSQWPDPGAFLQQVFREPPGRDIEFGYPDMRIENRLLSAFWQKHAPLALHISLHGMAFSEGAMLLIERHWIERSKELRRQFCEAAAAAGLPLHDHNRAGEKGFLYIAPGFTTTPEGRAMQAYFRDRNDDTTAGLFYLSSMEYLRGLGGDPLCLVSELPLFWLSPSATNKPGVPENYLAFQQARPILQNALSAGRDISETIQRYQLQAVAIDTAVRLQLQVIESGLQLLGEVRPE